VKHFIVPGTPVLQGYLFKIIHDLGKIGYGIIIMLIPGMDFPSMDAGEVLQPFPGLMFLKPFGLKQQNTGYGADYHQYHKDNDDGKPEFKFHGIHSFPNVI
jgi:hypothetical protein